MLLKGVEDALVPNSALSAIQIRSDSDVPYYRVGFVWRAIQHHLGKTKKDAEAEWKKGWTNSLRAVYEPIRKDIGLWEKQLQVNTLQWLEAAGQELQGRVKQLWKHENDLQEQSASTQEEHGVAYEHPGVETKAISQSNNTKEVEIVHPIDVSAPLVVAEPDVKLFTPSKTLLACTPDQYVEAWEWVGAVELRKLDHTFDETVAACFDDTNLDLNASLLALKDAYLRAAMGKLEASLKQLWNQESAMVL